MVSTLLGSNSTMTRRSYFGYAIIPDELKQKQISLKFSNMHMPRRQTTAVLSVHLLRRISNHSIPISSPMNTTLVRMSHNYRPIIITTIPASIVSTPSAAVPGETAPAVSPSSSTIPC
jgi:hypothetical protein